MERIDIHIKSYSEILKGRDQLGDLGKDGRSLLKWILKKYCVSVGTRLKLLKIGSNGRLL
jgi:hypothetical protein